MCMAIVLQRHLQWFRHILPYLTCEAVKMTNLEWIKSANIVCESFVRMLLEIFFRSRWVSIFSCKWCIENFGHELEKWDNLFCCTCLDLINSLRYLQTQPSRCLWQLRADPAVKYSPLFRLIPTRHGCVSMYAHCVGVKKTLHVFFTSAVNFIVDLQ